MKGLKIVLWITTIVCLIDFLGVIFPWTVTSSIASVFGMDIAGFDGLVKYGIGLGFTLFGLTGIFFLLLALNPLQYGAMLSLGGYGLVFIGLVALVWGIYYGFPAWVWVGDVVLCWILGVLILFFKSKAGEEKPAPAETAGEERA